MKRRVIEIIRELREVIQEECLSVSHDTLFVQALTCWRGEQAGGHQPKQESGDDSPTPKQIALLEKHKMPIPKTKKEASEKIDIFLKSLKKENI